MTLPAFKAELTSDDDLPERLLKGKRLYEHWASIGGTLKDFFPYDELSDYDRQRWVFFAKAIGERQHQFFQRPHPDVEKYGQGRTQQVDIYDWDEITHTTRSTAADVFYGLWVAQQRDQVRTHWWQFSRPTEVDTSRERFEQELRRKL